MRRAPAWLVVTGVLSLWLVIPSTATAASVWVTLAAGLPGSAVPTDSSQFEFSESQGSKIAVNQLKGGVSVTAATGGGTSFFGSIGIPVLLNLSDGSAYLASGNPPAAATMSKGTPASTAPKAGGTVPSDAALLGINVAESDGSSRALTATVTDSSGTTLGIGSLNVPKNGWFVLGLNPATDATTPTDPGTIVAPPVADPTPPVESDPGTGTSSPPSGNTPATPEPGTLVLVAIGGAAVQAWRRFRPSLEQMI